MSSSERPSFQLDGEVIVRARAEAYERRLSPEEFAAAVEAELSPSERAEKRSLIDWFTRRYPTPAERLAYAARYRASMKRVRPGQAP